MNLLRFLTVTSIAALLGAATVVGQDAKPKKPRVSPPGVATATIGGAEIKIAYGRPHVKDPKTGAPRTIWGGLVPYGQVWRTGANEATVLTTDKTIVIGGTELPAGKYSLFTVPTLGEDAKLIINKKTGQWGIPYREAEEKENEIARVPMKRAATPSDVEQFTISIDPTGTNSGTIKFAWADAYYSVDFDVKG